MLRSVLGEALHDPSAAALLAEFAATRRAGLRAVTDRAVDRGEIPDGDQVDLAVEQTFGLLWYRLAVSRADLDDALADRLTEALLTQLTGHRS